MQSLDKADNGCRRWCHKLLKDDFKKWLGKTGHKLPGMSTMIFKVGLYYLLCSYFDNRIEISVSFYKNG